MSENMIFRATCFFYNDTRKDKFIIANNIFIYIFFQTKEQNNLESHCYTT